MLNPSISFALKAMGFPSWSFRCGNRWSSILGRRSTNDPEGIHFKSQSLPTSMKYIEILYLPIWLQPWNSWPMTYDETPGVLQHFRMFASTQGFPLAMHGHGGSLEMDGSCLREKLLIFGWWYHGVPLWRNGNLHIPAFEGTTQYDTPQNPKILRTRSLPHGACLEFEAFLRPAVFGYKASANVSTGPANSWDGNQLGQTDSNAERSGAKTRNIH